MQTRLAISAGITSTSSFLVLAVFEVQGWRMPDETALLLVLIGLIMAGVALLIALQEMWKVTEPHLGRLQIPFRSPLKEPRVRDPNQWLLDIAQHDAENPQGELRILSQTVCNLNVEPGKRDPWIEVEYEFFNGGVHTILIGPARGEAVFTGKGGGRFSIEEVQGKHRVPRGGTDRFRVKVFLTPDVADEIFENEISVEVARSFRRIRSLSLMQVRLKVESEPQSGWPSTSVEIGLGQSDTYLVGDTN